MNYDDRQSSLLMAQLAKKRAMKEKYLRSQSQAQHPLTDRVMTNALLLAVKERVDIFGVIRWLCAQAPEYGQGGMDAAMVWLQVLADALGCGVYELFVEDRAKGQRIVTALLDALSNCDDWDDLRAEGNSGSFTLPGFDYAWRMSERPTATLRFEKKAEDNGVFYILSLSAEAPPTAPFPSRGVLWQERAGALQQFTDRVLAEAAGGRLARKEEFDELNRRLMERAETLRDLAAVVEQAPTGLSLAPLLRRETETLIQLQQQAQAAYERLPEGAKAGARSGLLLLGGAVKTLEGLGDPVTAEQLKEAVYLLENAASPV